MASSNEQPQQQPTDTQQSLSSDPSGHGTTMDSMAPRPVTTKVVSIAKPESTSPSLKGKQKDLDQSDSLDLDKVAKQFRASVSGKRLSGRPSVERLGSAKPQSAGENPSLTSLLSEGSDRSNTSPQKHQDNEGLMKQVSAWLRSERARRAARRAKRKAATKEAPRDTIANDHTDTSETTQSPATHHDRRDSDSSEGSLALENLATILERTLSLKSTEGSARKHRHSLSHGHGHKLAAMMKRRHSTVSSDTDQYDVGDQLVPSCEAVLDNSKTMAYGAGGPESGEGEGSARTSTKEKEAWATFKFEIVRLAHTLKLKGWRRVPLDTSGEIEVERLSGALTNAVYVVSPPKDLPSQSHDGSELPTPKNPPPKLLLRIYGPQVEHLIDREAELQILRRLGRKRIGPRMLGTFTNGRFEEFFYATTLTPQDLRIPDTSKQIAKRMRELHEGIDLLKSERAAGPFVWQNWDKWLNRVEKTVTWLDQQILEGKQGSIRSPTDKWKKRGLVCGTEWKVFRQMVEKYRTWLEEQYGGIEKVKERLVFAHNDTQYGNILRLKPAGESPLLLPANEHKQLVVIDFEYANANLPGLEFANHFTEWCYNYHDADKPYLCNTSYYPTHEEQHRFITAYLMHNPTYRAAGGSASNPPTPHLGPLPHSASTTALAATAAPSSSISAFMLDSRGPPSETKISYFEQEALTEQRTEQEARRLMAETRLWRLANSIQWVAWGIVQAQVPGMPDFEEHDEKEISGTSEKAKVLESATEEIRVEADAEKKNEVSAEESAGTGGDKANKENTSQDANKEPQEEEEEEFDYLGYARERAMFCWGDAIQLGIIPKKELPKEIEEQIKFVEA